MDKDVLITVSGLLFTGDEEQENVDVVTPGQYYFKNGKHYLLYEEQTEDFAEPTRNRIRISDDELLVRKSGLINGELLFRRGEDTASHYSTPFGSLVLGMHTTGLTVNKEKDELDIRAEYGLEINYRHASDCYIRIRVQPKTEGFSLRE